jgi:hypothetical protein
MCPIPHRGEVTLGLERLPKGFNRFCALTENLQAFTLLQIDAREFRSLRILAKHLLLQPQRYPDQRPVTSYLKMMGLNP